MDRFSWSDNSLNINEQILLVQKGVRLYNGPERTAFNKGKATVTTHRLFWADSAKTTCVLSLPLSYSVFLEKESGGFTKSPKIKIHLSTKEEHQPSGPFSQSAFSYIQLSFTEGGEEEFYRKLNEVVSERRWEGVPTKPVGFASKSVHSGISGIERSLQLKKQNRDATISVAFEDLNNLMTKAQEMVSLSKNISAKFRDKQGGVTEDEVFMLAYLLGTQIIKVILQDYQHDVNRCHPTFIFVKTLQFKSYLMSLGISDPITRDSHGTGGAYYEGLAREISQFIKAPLLDCGGVMTLTDVYCRMNRARGMELLSPEDLESACKLLEKLDLPVRMKEYENGVKVLQLHSCDEKMVAQETEQIIKEKGHLSAEELAALIGLSVVLAKQRLLVAESLGKLCRDESSEGITFYPNLFLTNA